MKNYIIAFTVVFGLWIQACSSQHDSNKINVPQTSGVAEQNDPHAQPHQEPKPEFQAPPEQREELPPPPPGYPNPADEPKPVLEMAKIVKEDGKKWKVNVEVIEAVDEIDKYVDIFILDESPTEQQFMEFALGVRERQHRVFDVSTVEPPADVHLQEFLLKIDEMVMHIESGQPEMRTAALETMHKQLHAFAIYFEE
ncbi:MAG: hypothetical protein HN542_02785 [Flavobacteriales bacterium]|jgi:hypothetical protein|nr:hypothetical protein [Flavobacteriales bacterium]MBT4704213.1 hypothetical protein [Flavobacteriales bacterium]MBT5132340.1 hypothetical protein [Flavobacteriales bacterium]MBT6132943.1 hypothetical protein [Flavobacteriales bacterium]MBT6382562.1 hypothetical protein [Flavobacteriales bacterium]